MQLLFSTVCLVLTSTVVSNAFIQKQQFYPAVVYITKSNASMAVIYVQFFVIVFMFGKLLRKIFLGTLRAAEFEHLLERFWYALTETCLAFTVFRDDFNPRFVALFTVLLFLKSFHWLAEERVDFMERSPVLGWLFHIRVSSLLAILGLLDNMLLMHAYNSTLMRGPTVQLVFGFEYAILLTVIASTAIKYVLHAAEMRTDTPWENKAVFLLYTELVIGLIKVILYVMFVVIMAKFYALPMFVFRPMFFTIRNFKKALSDVIMSRRAIRNMNTLYPDATTEELRLSDNICIICREDMVNHSKKLPCGHIFHTTCLRSWFQRQQTCPTCRLNILRASTPNSTAMPRQDDAAAQGRAAAAAAATPNIAPNQINVDATATNNANPATNLPNMFSNLSGTNPLLNVMPGFPGMPANFQTMPIAPPPFMMPPPFPFVAPFTCPPPPMPSDLTSLSDEELKAMEGNERRNIEERLKLLKNIQIMLDAAGELMNNYQIIAANLQVSAPVDVTKTTTTTTTAAAATTLPTTTTTNANDGPSTSAAAAAAQAFSTAFLNESLAAAPNNTNGKCVAGVAGAAVVCGTKEEELPTTSSLSSSTTTTSKLNAVTIEDLGADDCDDNLQKSTIQKETASAAENTLITHIINDSSDASELKNDELRKRRLKFLDEHQKH